MAVVQRFLRVDADVYGTIATSEVDPRLHLRSASAPRGPLTRLFRKSEADQALSNDGTLVVGNERMQLASLAGASAYSVHDERIAVSMNDSHRITILAPWRDPL